jgi:uncharacterized protein
MKLSQQDKQGIKRRLVECLSDQAEVRRVVVFGSFVSSPDPNDLDVAVFQDSDETYLPLALKYRKLLRPVADLIPLDVLPLRTSAHPGWFVRDEVLRGEVIYER